jgi:hypothetical protein
LTENWHLSYFGPFISVLYSIGSDSVLILLWINYRNGKVIHVWMISTNASTTQMFVWIKSGPRVQIKMGHLPVTALSVLWNMIIDVKVMYVWILPKCEKISTYQILSIIIIFIRMQIPKDTLFKYHSVHIDWLKV